MELALWIAAGLLVLWGFGCLWWLRGINKEIARARDYYTVPPRSPERRKKGF